MKRRATLVSAVLLALILVLAATGCGGTKVVTTSGGSELGTVSASGSGKVPASPDIADMTFGGTSQDVSAKVALSAASKTAEQISAAVQKAGVNKLDIQTQAVTVYPVMSPDSSQITGYQANLSVAVKVRNLDTLGDVITAAANAGATTINGPTFDVANRLPYEQEAIDKAVQDARKKAEALAKAAGKSVGDVVKISLSGSETGPVPLASADLSAKGASVPIEPGQMEISQDVTVVFALK